MYVKIHRFIDDLVAINDVEELGYISIRIGFQNSEV